MGTQIYQTRPRDPEAKGVVERANGFLQTSFLPGREFGSPVEFNTQLGAWLPRANQRLLRRTGAAPAARLAAEVAAMTALPPVPPAVGFSDRIRLGRDYYVRVMGNDYSVDPTMIGRFVDITCSLEHVTVRCAGTVVARHERCWDLRRTITDPTHVAAAKQLRAAFQSRTTPAARRAEPSQQVGLRPLSDYDELFNINTAAQSVKEVA
ncbi:hypothetical protein H5392_05330 [Tessaracoccus sp. MC1865]|uniref:Mu transposase domain-containing protein n=1 Tax=Tessaracoccus sp. MC1865 TaxID=2760310 RepID=UPI0016016C80|nr:hypothetical protein [Tessaracoccus sp. MC1865]MBB1483287.1 hypothetical protein [Tessaracoccus sp. MC1865]QTO37301.1 hypothetical protein J7D54_12880 [Tessaracoccus sp. MC1865]